jgi:uncharacterized membrane protein
MNAFQDRVTSLFQREAVTARLFTAWIAVSFFNSWYSDDFISLAFCANEPLWQFLLKVILCFALLSVVVSFFHANMDCPFLLVFTVLYSLRITSVNSSVYLLFAVCMVNILMLLFYRQTLLAWANAIHKLVSSSRASRAAVCLLFVLGLGISAYVMVLTICRHASARSSTFDMGIFVQMFYSMKEQFSMITTCERNTLMSHMSVHVSPFFYLLLPFYCIYPHAETLLVLQAFAVFLGLIPLYLLCRKFRLSTPVTVLFGVVYLLSPATLGGLFYDFHENAFLLPLLLWLFYCYECHYPWRMIIFALLVCSVKEDATIFVLVFGLYVLLSRREPKYAFVCIGISVVWMACSLYYLSLHGQGLMTVHYGNLVNDTDHGFISILTTLIVNPAYLFDQMLNNDKVQFLLTVFLPVTILPFATKKVSRYVLLIPFVFINLLPSYIYQHSVFYQYVFAPYLFILYLSLLNLADCKQNPRRTLIVICAVCTCLSFVSQITQKNYYLPTFQSETSVRANLADMAQSIPNDASVAASTFLVPQLAERERIYMLDASILEEDAVPETDYAVFDLRNGFADEDVLDEIAQYEAAGYQNWKECDGVYVVLQK